MLLKMERWRFLGGAREYTGTWKDTFYCHLVLNLHLLGIKSGCKVRMNKKKKNKNSHFGCGSLILTTITANINLNITAVLCSRKIKTNSYGGGENVLHAFCSLILVFVNLMCCRLQVQRENVSASEVQLPGGSVQLPWCRQHLGTAPDRARDRLLHWQLLFRRHAVQQR